MEKFKLRWDQMKPKEDSTMDGDSTKIAAALKLIKEKRIEWNSLIETKVRN